MTARSAVAPGPLPRTIGLAGPVRGRLTLATLLGPGRVAADIGLIATAAWLISKAAEHPNQADWRWPSSAVQFFGLSRGFFATASGWSAMARPSACSPTCGYACTSTSTLGPLAPGRASRRSGGVTC